MPAVPLVGHARASLENLFRYNNESAAADDPGEISAVKPRWFEGAATHDGPAIITVHSGAVPTRTIERVIT